MLERIQLVISEMYYIIRSSMEINYQILESITIKAKINEAKKS